ncbi:protein NRDE2-like [Tropilaelaps mercedesae]|uniref:Protein NRDE2-like n=1 Tax=Tropilaelaps mercedesae TaxID=418985 RepID=A0A1V9Y0A0_9ACAR|nr:protein NRDE2-like [Tropilaelaps mercedesae]
MFPAYASNPAPKVASPDDVSWLQCTSYSCPAGAADVDQSTSNSSDTDDDLARVIEERKAQSELRADNAPRVGAISQDSECSSDEFRRRKRSRKDIKKHKKKKKKKDGKRDRRSERSPCGKHRKKKSKLKQSRSSSRSPSPDIRSDLSRKWAFLEDIGPMGIPFVLDIRGDQSNRAFAQLPHTSAAVYKVRKGVLSYARKKSKRYFKAPIAPPMITVEVNEKLRALKPSTYISLGDALLPDRDEADQGQPRWPSLVREHSQLATQCRENPDNVALWLKLCDFEKVFVPCSLGKAQVSSQALKKMIMEKQLSVMSDAIMKNPIDLRLRLRKFDLLCSLERQGELAREWDDVLRMSDYSMNEQETKNQIWLEYAHYARSKFRVVAKFSVEEATAGYRRAIDAFRRTRIDDMFLVTLIEDFAHFHVQCGHTERAVAIFQALLDFNLSQPGHLATQNEEVVKALFEPFWDSGCAKIGEENHEGWGKEKRCPDGPPPAEEVDPREDELITADRPLNVVWATLETLRQRKHWMPARVDAEDVERIVLFDDVSMCVFRSRDPKCLQKMLQAFMRFLARGDTSYMAWSSTSDKMAAILKVPFARDEAEGRMDVLWNCYKAGIHFLPQFDWGAELLDRLLELCPSDKDKAVSLAKKLTQLKCNQMNLTFWAKLLLILAAGKAREEALSRGVKLMSMACAGLGNFSGDHVYFLATYLRIYLGLDDILKADLDEQNSRMPDIKGMFSFWGALILGRKATLSEVNAEHIACLDKYLGDRDDKHSVEVAVMLQLSVDGPVSAYAYLCRRASILSEEVYHRINILLHLLVYRHFSPSLTDLRSTISLACHKLPANRDYMVLLALVSYRSPHSWMHCPIPQHDAEHAWFPTMLFYLLRSAEYAEWQKQQQVAYSGSRIGALRRAVAQLGEIREPLFWRLAAWVEMQAGETNRAKALLLQGLQCCPWSKAIFVDCALYFDDMLQQVVDTLSEKGLRLRTPLEELTLLLETEHIQK